MRRPGTMELDTRRPLQASNVRARRRAAVEGLLAVFVQILSAGQGKAKARARVNIAWPSWRGRRSRPLGRVCLLYRSRPNERHGERQNSQHAISSHFSADYVLPGSSHKADLPNLAGFSRASCGEPVFTFSYRRESAGGSLPPARSKCRRGSRRAHRCQRSGAQDQQLPASATGSAKQDLTSPRLSRA